MCPTARAFFRSARVPDADLRRPARRVSLRPLPVALLLALLASLLLSGCGQGVRVQPKGQVQTSIGVGR